ncbi:MAG TPA: energy transducer TonB [Blastocatellia bacterium]|nr:energy transducer TonB [Blastocatellia bacterium]
MQQHTLFVGALSARPSLISRLINEFREASRDFRQDPKCYITSALRGDPIGGHRRKLLLKLGLTIAIAFYLAVFGILLILSLINPRQAEYSANKTRHTITLFNYMPQDAVLPDSDEQARGGGGGGREMAAPASQGTPPPFSLDMPIIAPTTRQPIQPPMLAVDETLLGDPTQNTNRGEMIVTGLETGIPGPPSDGPGSGGGIGMGNRGGVGSGDGPGYGPGENGGQGGGRNGPGGRLRQPEVVSSVDSRPIALNRPRPNYTEEARKIKVQGVVHARVLVGTDGRVQEVRIVRGLPAGLNEEAIRAAVQMRFKPAIKNGQPVAYWVTLQIEFNLR